LSRARDEDPCSCPAEVANCRAQAFGANDPPDAHHAEDGKQAELEVAKFISLYATGLRSAKPNCSYHGATDGWLLQPKDYQTAVSVAGQRADAPKPWSTPERLLARTEFERHAHGEPMPQRSVRRSIHPA